MGGGQGGGDCITFFQGRRQCPEAGTCPGSQASMFGKYSWPLNKASLNFRGWLILGFFFSSQHYSTIRPVFGGIHGLTDVEEMWIWGPTTLYADFRLCKGRHPNPHVVQESAVFTPRALFCFVDLRPFTAGSCIPSFMCSFKDISQASSLCWALEMLRGDGIPVSRSVQVNGGDEQVNKGYPR